MKKPLCLLIISILFASNLFAKIKIASILGDNMVLQQNSVVKIWGTADVSQKVTVSTNWNKDKITVVTNDKGEWVAKISTTEAGGPYSIQITAGKEKLSISNILLGEVWLCSGQSNMEMPIKGYIDQPVNGSNETIVRAVNNNLRLFTVARSSKSTPQDSCRGKWEIADASTVADFSATGYYFGAQLQKSLNIPIGLICSSWGGSRIEAWIDNDNIIKHPESYRITTKERSAAHQHASYLYNGMIAPIKNYSIRGAVWYQGESNRVEYQYYAALMKTLADSWKVSFNLTELPFYFVQIAPHWYKDQNDVLSGKFYDEQFKAEKMIPNAGMAATVDIGDEYCVHPAEKEMVGARLSYCALAETYNIKGISYKNPSYKSMVVKDSSIVISFDNIAMGLTSFGKEITNVEIAGEDQHFYAAKAVIKNQQLIVTSAEIKKPVSVRYCYRNYMSGKGFIYNTAGLPVLPFRTDSW